MLTPGFVTDVIGVLFLPPTRAVVRRLMIGLLTRRLLGAPIPRENGP